MKRNNIKLVAVLTILLALNACVDNNQAQLRANANHGLELYERMCANCHQSDGKGFVKLYPPLRNSDYFNNKNDSEIFYIIKNGLKGNITVNDVNFNLPMPANPKLSNEEIEHIIEYVETRFLSINEVK